MKQIIFLLFVLVSSFAVANEFDNDWSSSYAFGSMSGLDGYPMVGGGVRLRSQAHILELAASVAPVNQFSPVVYHAKALYLICPSQRGLYLGAGVGLISDTNSYKKNEGTIESSLGYEWITKAHKRVFLETNFLYAMNKKEWNWADVDSGLSLGLGF